MGPSKVIEESDESELMPSMRPNASTAATLLKLGAMRRGSE